ncbi:MAG: CinA family protein [Phycisphaerales bacterium]|jgi:PncC family amidohydrolase|nr:CinA family protein [Phycisphaerales bacterium]
MIPSNAKFVGELLQRCGGTLVTAESCTGGLIAESITTISGASSWYLGGWVTYSNEMKVSQLKVSEELLKEHGAVSSHVAKAMCLGAKQQSDSFAALSTTGIAGPTGGTSEKPVGTVYVGCTVQNETEVRSFLFKGSRKEVKEKTANAAFQLLRDMLSDDNHR